MALKTSPAFVDSVWELFGPLLARVPLVAVPPTVARDPAQASVAGPALRGLHAGQNASSCRNPRPL